MGLPFRVGLYARVSTHDQHTLSLQLDVLRTYAAQRSWSVVTEVQMAGSSPPEAPSP
jgi:putative DNA-invertase from lambdoid prophage Rac